MKKSVTNNLSNKRVLEYPTFFIVTKRDTNKYPVIEGNHDMSMVDNILSGCHEPHARYPLKRRQGDHSRGRGGFKSRGGNASKKSDSEGNNSTERNPTERNYEAMHGFL